MLASCEDMPPRLITLKACTRASTQLMPPSHSARMQNTVTITYTSHSPLAVSAMRGVSLLSFIGVGVSALNSWRPPTPSIGSTATTSTITPMPPIQCISVRQTLIEGGRSSSPESTVAPVAVSPDTASK
jgi:hypothetical protein